MGAASGADVWSHGDKMRLDDLHRRLFDIPFRPFRIKMVNNSVYDVVDPGMVIPGKSSAVVAAAHVRDAQGYITATDWRTISIGHIIEFSDLDTKEMRRKR